MGSIRVKPAGYEADLPGLPRAGYWHLFRNAVRVRVSGWSASRFLPMISTVP